MSVKSRATILAVVGAIMAPATAFAYVGPGAGLGMVGSLVAVLGAMLVALVGLVVLPVRLLLKRRRAKAAGEQKPIAAGQAPDG